eukprot:9489919-Pyramimonas_sp.AAC.1
MQLLSRHGPREWRASMRTLPLGAKVELYGARSPREVRRRGRGGAAPSPSLGPQEKLPERRDPRGNLRPPIPNTA